MTGNRRDRELDIVLVSAKDGTVIRNLTSGFDKDYGFESISLPGRRWNTVSWMSWSPGGDRIAYFVRNGANRALVLQNVLTRKVEKKIDLPTVDEPESPNISPDGRKVAFAGLRGARGDIFMVDLETEEVTNVTNDEFWDFAPVFSPDGRSLVYLSRITGNDKIFRIDLETKAKRQLTFGTHDDAAARFLDAKTISSRPRQPTRFSRSTLTLPGTVRPSTSGRSTSRPASSTSGPTRSVRTSRRSSSTKGGNRRSLHLHESESTPACPGSGSSDATPNRPTSARPAP